MNTTEINNATDFIKEKTDYQPEIGIILGSGLGPLADEIENAIKIKYADIPYFAKSEAIGHDNELIIGELKGRTVVAMKGRFHFYEGFTPQQVTFPVHVMKALGINKLIITNSCGAINTSFSPGELMIITDHINTTGTNPFIGPNDDKIGPRFTDLSEVYSKRLRSLAKKIAKDNDISINEGVYSWWTGPAYETPAEIKMLRIMGADAVGMSTVPEAMVASYYGLETLGISCLTNMACGILDKPLNHNEVLEVASTVKEKFTKLVLDTIKVI